MSEQQQDVIFRKASLIRLILMDVDGVLTDGKVYFVPDGHGGLFETKCFDTQDGLAFHWLHAAGIGTGVISGRKSPVVEERARQGHFTYVYQGYLEKIPIVEEILKLSGLRPEEVAYIGDDLTDIVVMRRVGLAVAPANARPEVKLVADTVTQAAGGHGAVRELAEWVLKAQGFWDDILRKYEVTTEDPSAKYAR